jgi:uncharacterized protein (TIGR00730 family)
MSLDSVCVFCGAQNAVPQEHLDIATKLGTELAAANKALVYGGGDCGLMGRVANSVLEAKGKVIGVFPRGLRRIEMEHTGLTKMFLVDSMHERKQIMYDHADVFVILPGGCGTLDEMFEVITWRQIGIHDKPVLIFNHKGYWNHLVALLDGMIETGFARAETRKFYTVVDSFEELLGALEIEKIAEPA